MAVITHTMQSTAERVMLGFQLIEDNGGHRIENFCFH